MAYVRRASASFTRPDNTSAYQANDLVANDTTAADVVPMVFSLGTGGGKVVAVRIVKTDATDVANATFSVRLFETLPTVTNGDNGAIAHPVAGLIGIVPLPIMVAAADDAWTRINVGETNFVGGIYVAGPNVYGLLEAEAAYTPAAEEVFTVTLYVE